MDGQTNVTLTNLWPKDGFFQIGTMTDTDLDGLPDAFEQFATKTNPQMRDSDSDGISDGDEMGPNGLPWGLEQTRDNSIVVHANAPTTSEGGPCGQFTVHLPNPAPAGGVTVYYRFGGTAVPESEFNATPSGNALVIPAGYSSGAITVCAVDDSAYQESDRYIDITLTNASVFTVDSQSARISVRDNDFPGVRVFAFPQWVRKPSATFGTNSAAFYFIRDGDCTDPLTLGFTPGGTAVAGTDYDYLPIWSITFPANVRTNLLPVTLKPTTNAEDKTLTLTLYPVAGYQPDPGASSATMTIAASTLPALPLVQVTATDDDARETNLNVGVFTFTRSSTAGSLRVFYHVTGNAWGGATNSPEDYVALPGYVDFAPGVASVPVTVSPLDDLESETVETVIVTIAGGDYRIGANNRATVYIDDNEPVTYAAEVTRPGVHGTSTSRVLYGRVTRYGSALSAASGAWTLTYTLGASTLTGVFPGGDVSGNNIVWTARKSVANVTFGTTWTSHPDQALNVNLKFNGGLFNGYPAYLPQSQVVRVSGLTPTGTVVPEGATISTALAFTRPWPSSSSLTASYNVRGGAINGTDYTGPGNSVFFPAGSAGPIYVSVQAYSNAQTNGWRTGVVEIDTTGTSYVGDSGFDRAFFRIQDAQVSNPTPDTDIDSDGLSDGWELDNGSDPLTADDSHTDADRDGLALFEEIQLGTDPDVADAQPVYPSEDPDDYVPLTLRLGATGKLADQVGCASCHSAGLRAGPHSRSTPRTTWQYPENTQDHLIRFLRGTNYSVRLMDDPYSKVLSSGQTNSTPRKYTAKYTAQFLTASNAAYTLIRDDNQLFGTNRAMITEALARTATVYVPDMIIAADVDRDGSVDAGSRTDRTSPNSQMVFWINNDVDVGNDDTAGDEEPGVSGNPINNSNSVIDNLRDLEDFTRLHLLVDGLPGSFLTNGGWQTRIYVTNLIGTPSLRLFRAAEANGGVAYLTNTTTANMQASMGTLGLVAGGTPLTLTGAEWKSAGSNRFFLPTIVEGISTGQCVIVFALATNNGPDVALSRPFYLIYGT
jgi:hypothetical protein